MTDEAKKEISLNFPPKISLILIFWAGIGLLNGCDLKKETQFSGKTMGTTYQIKVVTDYFAKVSPLEKKIELCLEGINHSMSTYEKDSEISRFNSIKDSTRPCQATKDFYAVMKTARKIFKLTSGAWDGTIDPLVNIWGFGRSGTKFEVPTKSEIKSKLSQVGFNQIEFLPNQILKKRESAITLDLASIAKGYGVDKVSELLLKNKINNFIVEIGGEVYAVGRRKDGQKWRVGINEPRIDAPVDAVYTTLTIENKGLATSGDYRNFIEIDGKRYSHIIDSKTGWPVDNGVVSVSVLADTCALADGLATAILVMGSKKGLALLDRLDSVEGMILITKANGALEEFTSKGFQPKKPQS
jgi:thiamine biosynthesis lipoprotein